MRGRRIGRGEIDTRIGMNGTPGFNAAHTENGIAKAATKSSLKIKLIATAPV